MTQTHNTKHRRSRKKRNKRRRTRRKKRNRRRRSKALGLHKITILLPVVDFNSSFHH